MHRSRSTHRASRRGPGRRLASVASALLAVACGGVRPPAPLPQRLADTGLYDDFASRRLADSVLPYSPQYPLWTDGAGKRRWILLPPGTSIDAADPDHWEFPAGTRLWKEFAFGRAVETRFLERLADGTWRYATYHWNEDGSDAVLAPADGVRSVCETRDGARHDLPSVADCRSCHEGTRTPVLGFSALQLSPDRDPLAPHAEPLPEGAIDLHGLMDRGLLRNAPEHWRAGPPRIAAATPRERAAVGYLHGNCSSCHNAEGPLQRLGLRFDVPLAVPATADAPLPAIATTRAVPSRFLRPGLVHRAAPGDPAASVLLHRLAATDPLTQMPPFGRHLADDDARELLADWITHDLMPAVAVGDEPVARRD